MTKSLVVIGAAAFLFAAATASAATAPTVSTGRASAISASSATLNGSVTPNGVETNWYFQYGTSTTYGSKTAVQSAGSGTTAVAVSSPISGLQNGKTYHFRVVATSGGGTSVGADGAFTAVTGAAAPAVATEGASPVADKTATLRGAINPHAESTHWYFEYGTTTAYGTKTAVKSVGSGNAAVGVASGISGLAVGTTYHFRLVAANAVGATFGEDRSFVTLGPAAVLTGAEQNVAAATATLTGAVNPRGHGTNWHFDYGTSTAYGLKTPTQGAGSGSTAVAVSANISGLAPSTTYHFRLVASSSAGTAVGADHAFTTLAAVTISQSGFRIIASHYARLSGTVTGGQVGVTVTVLAQPFGQSSFTPVGTALTGSGGAWTYLAKPTIRTDYEASANGGTSGVVTIGTQPAVSLQLIKGARYSTRVSAGTTSFAGKFVQFQRFNGVKWVTIKRSRLGSSSMAIFSKSLLPRGKYKIRIAFSVNQAGPGYLGGFSRTLVYKRS